jgi:hypothetical protein
MRWPAPGFAHFESACSPFGISTTLNDSGGEGTSRPACFDEAGGWCNRKAQERRPESITRPPDGLVGSQGLIPPPSMRQMAVLNPAGEAEGSRSSTFGRRSGTATASMW